MPPAFWQSASVIAFVTSWAKAGQVNAIAADNVQIETRIFIDVLLRVRAALAPFYALLCRCSIVLLAARYWENDETSAPLKPSNPIPLPSRWRPQTPS